MFFRRFVLIAAAALCAAVSPVLSQVTTPIIFTPTSATRVYVFPPIGLGSGETASITVVNTASPSTTETGTLPPQPSCSGTISFSNANGAIGAPTSFTVGSEGFKTVTLPFASAGLTGNRGEIQGTVSLSISGSTPTPCSLMFSLETYDSTTFATHVVLSNSLSILIGGQFPIAIPE
jgi:hypothetical protein